jgi:hypothetical protein
MGFMGGVTRHGLLASVLVMLALAGCGAVAGPLHTPSPPPTAAGPSPTPPAPSFGPLQLVKPGPVYGTAVDFQEVGLAPGETVPYSATAQAILTYSCGSGSLTAGKQLTFARSFTADASGTVSGRVTLEMTPPVCSNGGRFMPLQFETTAAELTDTIHGARLALPHAFVQFD